MPNAICGIQCGAVITRSIVFCESRIWYSATVSVIIYVTYFYIGPRYNSTRLYHSPLVIPCGSFTHSIQGFCTGTGDSFDHTIPCGVMPIRTWKWNRLAAHHNKHNKKLYIIFAMHCFPVKFDIHSKCVRCGILIVVFNDAISRTCVINSNFLVFIKTTNAVDRNSYMWLPFAPLWREYS